MQPLYPGLRVWAGHHNQGNQETPKNMTVLQINFYDDTFNFGPEWKLIDNEMQWRWQDLNKTSLSPKSEPACASRALNPNVPLKTESECWSVCWAHITISRLWLRHQFKVVRFVRLGPSEECESDVWGARAHPAGADPRMSNIFA